MYHQNKTEPTTHTNTLHFKKVKMVTKSRIGDQLNIMHLFTRLVSTKSCFRKDSEDFTQKTSVRIDVVEAKEETTLIQEVALRSEHSRTDSSENAESANLQETRFEEQRRINESRIELDSSENAESANLQETRFEEQRRINESRIELDSSELEEPVNNFEIQEIIEGINTPVDSTESAATTLRSKFLRDILAWDTAHSIINNCSEKEIQDLKNQVNHLKNFVIVKAESQKIRSHKIKNSTKPYNFNRNPDQHFVRSTNNGAALKKSFYNPTRLISPTNVNSPLWINTFLFRYANCSHNKRTAKFILSHYAVTRQCSNAELVGGAHKKEVYEKQIQHADHVKQETVLFAQQLIHWIATRSTPTSEKLASPCLPIYKSCERKPSDKCRLTLCVQGARNVVRINIALYDKVLTIEQKIKEENIPDSSRNGVVGKIVSQSNELLTNVIALEIGTQYLPKNGVKVNLNREILAAKNYVALWSFCYRPLKLEAQKRDFTKRSNLDNFLFSQKDSREWLFEFTKNYSQMQASIYGFKKVIALNGNSSLKLKTRVRLALLEKKLHNVSIQLINSIYVDVKKRFISGEINEVSAKKEISDHVASALDNVKAQIRINALVLRNWSWRQLTLTPKKFFKPESSKRGFSTQSKKNSELANNLALWNLEDSRLDVKLFYLRVQSTNYLNEQEKETAVRCLEYKESYDTLFFQRFPGREHHKEPFMVEFLRNCRYVRAEELTARRQKGIFYGDYAVEEANYALLQWSISWIDERICILDTQKLLCEMHQDDRDFASFNKKDVLCVLRSEKIKYFVNCHPNVLENTPLFTRNRTRENKTKCFLKDLSRNLQVEMFQRFTESISLLQKKFAKEETRENEYFEGEVVEAHDQSLELRKEMVDRVRSTFIVWLRGRGTKPPTKKPPVCIVNATVPVDFIRHFPTEPEIIPEKPIYMSRMAQPFGSSKRRFSTKAGKVGLEKDEQQRVADEAVKKESTAEKKARIALEKEERAVKNQKKEEEKAARKVISDEKKENAQAKKLASQEKKTRARRIAADPAAALEAREAKNKERRERNNQPERKARRSAQRKLAREKKNKRDPLWEDKRAGLALRKAEVQLKKNAAENKKVAKEQARAEKAATKKERAEATAEQKKSKEAQNLIVTAEKAKKVEDQQSEKNKKAEQKSLEKLAEQEKKAQIALEKKNAKDPLWKEKETQRALRKIEIQSEKDLVKNNKLVRENARFVKAAAKRMKAEAKIAAKEHKQQTAAIEKAEIKERKAKAKQEEQEKKKADKAQAKKDKILENKYKIDPLWKEKEEAAKSNKLARELTRSVKASSKRAKAEAKKDKSVAKERQQQIAAAEKADIKENKAKIKQEEKAKKVDQKRLAKLAEQEKKKADAAQAKEDKKQTVELQNVVFNVKKAPISPTTIGNGVLPTNTTRSFSTWIQSSNASLGFSRPKSFNHFKKTFHVFCALYSSSEESGVENLTYLGEDLEEIKADLKARKKELAARKIVFKLSPNNATLKEQLYVRNQTIEYGKDYYKVKENKERRERDNQPEKKAKRSARRKLARQVKNSTDPVKVAAKIVAAEGRAKKEKAKQQKKAESDIKKQNLAEKKAGVALAKAAREEQKQKKEEEKTARKVISDEKKENAQAKKLASQEKKTRARRIAADPAAALEARETKNKERRERDNQPERKAKISAQRKLAREKKNKRDPLWEDKRAQRAMRSVQIQEKKEKSLAKKQSAAETKATRLIKKAAAEEKKRLAEERAKDPEARFAAKLAKNRARRLDDNSVKREKVREKANARKKLARFNAKHDPVRLEKKAAEKFARDEERAQVQRDKALIKKNSKDAERQAKQLTREKIAKEKKLEAAKKKEEAKNKKASEAADKKAADTASKTAKKRAEVKEKKLRSVDKSANIERAVGKTKAVKKVSVRATKVGTAPLPKDPSRSFSSWTRETVIPLNLFGFKAPTSVSSTVACPAQQSQTFFVKMHDSRDCVSDTELVADLMARKSELAAREFVLTENPSSARLEEQVRIRKSVVWVGGAQLKSENVFKFREHLSQFKQKEYGQGGNIQSDVQAQETTDQQRAKRQAVIAIKKAYRNKSRLLKKNSKVAKDFHAALRSYFLLKLSEKKLAETRLKREIRKMDFCSPKRVEKENRNWPWVWVYKNNYPSVKNFFCSKHPNTSIGFSSQKDSRRFKKNFHSSRINMRFKYLEHSLSKPKLKPRRQVEIKLSKEPKKEVAPAKPLQEIKVPRVSLDQKNKTQSVVDEAAASQAITPDSSTKQSGKIAHVVIDWVNNKNPAAKNNDWKKKALPRVGDFLNTDGEGSWECGIKRNPVTAPFGVDPITEEVYPCKKWIRKTLTTITIPLEVCRGLPVPTRPEVKPVAVVTVARAKKEITPAKVQESVQLTVISTKQSLFPENTHKNPYLLKNFNTAARYREYLLKQFLNRANTPKVGVKIRKKSKKYKGKKNKKRSWAAKAKAKAKAKRRKNSRGRYRRIRTHEIGHTITKLYQRNAREEIQLRDYDLSKTATVLTNYKTHTFFHLSSKYKPYSHQRRSFNKTEIRRVSVTGRPINFFELNKKITRLPETWERNQALILKEHEEVLIRQEACPLLKNRSNPLEVSKPGQGYYSFQTLDSLYDAIADEARELKAYEEKKLCPPALSIRGPFWDNNAKVVTFLEYDKAKLITLAWMRIRAGIFYPLVPRYEDLRQPYFKNLLKNKPEIFRALFNITVPIPNRLVLSDVVSPRAKIKLRHQIRKRGFGPFTRSAERSQRTSSVRRRHLDSLLFAYDFGELIDPRRQVAFRKLYGYSHKLALKRKQRRALKKKRFQDPDKFTHFSVRARKWRNRRRKRKAKPHAKRVVGDRRWKSRKIKWPYVFPQPRQYPLHQWLQRKLSRKRGNAGLAQTFFRPRSGLHKVGSNTQKTFFAERRNKREDLKKIIPYYSVNYKLKFRKWHTPRDINGSPLPPIELSETTKRKRVIEKGIRHYAKQGLILQSRAAKSRKLRNRLRRKALSAEFKAPKYQDFTWRDLELRTGYPATLAYRYQRRTYRNSFVTNRWWQPTAEPTRVLHPFSLVPAEQQPRRFRNHPSKALYYTDLELRQELLWKAINAGLSTILPNHPSAFVFEKSKEAVYRIRNFPLHPKGKRDATWQKYFTIISGKQWQSDSLFSAFYDDVPNWITKREEEEEISKVEKAVWVKEAKSFNKNCKPGQSKITYKQAKAAAIEKSRLAFFASQPNWWVEEARLRKQALQTVTKRFTSLLFKRAVYRLRSRAKKHHRKRRYIRARIKLLKLPTEGLYPDQAKNFLIFYNKRFSKKIKSSVSVLGLKISKQPKMRVSITEKAFCQVYYLHVEYLRERQAQAKRQEHTSVLVYGEKLKKRELARNEETVGYKTNLDPYLKENGTVYQIWRTGRKVRTKNTLSETSSYIHDVEKKQTVLELPFEAPRFPATANRQNSYARAVRTFYNKTVTPRLRTINSINSIEIEAIKLRDKKTFSAHYARNSTARAKRRSLAKASTASYLSKNARTLARVLRQERPSKLVRSVRTAPGARKTVVKRRFARSPFAITAQETKALELERRGAFRKGHVVYLAGVLKIARKRRRKLRVVTEKKKLIRQRRTGPEQILPRQRRMQRRKWLAKRAKNKKNARKTAARSRADFHSWIIARSKAKVKKRGKRPERIFFVDAGGVALTEVTNIDRLEWAKHGYSTQSLARREYPRTLTEARKPRRSKKVKKAYPILRPGPNKRGKRKTFVNGWLRRKIKKNQKLRRKLKSLRTVRKFYYRKFQQKRHDDLYSQASILWRTKHAERRTRTEVQKPLFRDSVFPRGGRFGACQFIFRYRSPLYTRAWSPRRLRLKIKKVGRTPFQVKGMSSVTRVREKFAKRELKKNPIKTTNSRILEGISFPSSTLPVSFYPDRVEIIDTAAVTLKDKAFQIATTRALYRVTGEIAASTTQLFSHLISWLRKYRGSGSNRDQEDAESLVSATYWNLRVYLGQDLLGLRLWTKDKSLAQRHNLSDEVQINSNDRPYSAAHTRTRRKRRQPYYLTRKVPQPKASLEWLRHWFPRLYKFHLESPDAFENLTFTLPEARRTKPTSAAVKDWETQDISSNAELTFERLTKTEVHKNSGRYECRLRTARRREAVDTCKDFRAQLLYGAVSTPRPTRPQFFAKGYSTQCAPDINHAVKELLIARAEQQKLNSALDDRRSHRQQLQIHTAVKTRINKRGLNRGASRRGEARAGRIDPRVTRQKSPRNALYQQRRPQSNDKVELLRTSITYKSDLQNFGGPQHAVTKKMGEFQDREKVLSIKAQVVARRKNRKLSKVEELRNARYVRRLASAKDTQLEPKPLELLKRILPLNGNSKDYNQNLNIKPGESINYVRWHSSSDADSQVIIHYHPKISRTAEFHLKPGVAKNYHLIQSKRPYVIHRKNYEYTEYGVVQCKPPAPKLQPKLDLKVLSQQLTITPAYEINTFLSLAITSDARTNFVVPLFDSAIVMKKVRVGYFRIVADPTEGAVITRSEKFLAKKSKKNRNLLNNKRSELWAKLTTKYYLKRRLVKNWTKDRKRYLLRIKWRHMPEIIFKERRTRLRTFEWRESDKHFYRRGWKYAFNLMPGEKYRARWFEPIRRRRTAYNTRHGEYRRYSFPREQKSLKALQYYRKARISTEPHRMYVQCRRWPRLRTTAYRRYRSFFEFRNTRVAQKQFKKASKMSARTTGFSRNVTGLRNRLDVVIQQLRLFKSVRWVRLIARFGIVQVNGKTVYDANYRLQPGDILVFNWPKVNKLQTEFTVEKRGSFQDKEVVPECKLQRIPGNFSWFPNLNLLYYNRLPTPDDLLKNTRVIQWSFDSFRRDAGIGRR